MQFVVSAHNLYNDKQIKKAAAKSRMKITGMDAETEANMLKWTKLYKSMKDSERGIENFIRLLSRQTQEKVNEMKELQKAMVASWDAYFEREKCTIQQDMEAFNGCKKLEEDLRVRELTRKESISEQRVALDNQKHQALKNIAVGIEPV